MPRVIITITREDFIQDRQGRTFADVLNDSETPFDAVLEFFSSPDRQLRMQESEIHHDRSPLAGVVRELESLPELDSFLSSKHPHRTKRLRQAVGVIVRMVMEGLGWKKTGKKGSLGVRASVASGTTTPGAYHNTGGLAFWFLRTERYARAGGMPFPSVKDRARKLKPKSVSQKSSSAKRQAPTNGRESPAAKVTPPAGKVTPPAAKRKSPTSK